MYNYYLIESPDSCLSTGLPFFFINNKIIIWDSKNIPAKTKLTHHLFFELLIKKRHYSTTMPIQAIGRLCGNILSFWASPASRGFINDGSPIIGIDKCVHAFEKSYTITIVEYVNNRIPISIWNNIDFKKLTVLNLDTIDTFLRYNNFNKIDTITADEIIDQLNNNDIPDNDVYNEYKNSISRLTLLQQKLNDHPNWIPIRKENLKNIIEDEKIKSEKLYKRYILLQIKNLENSIKHEMLPSEKQKIYNKIQQLKHKIHNSTTNISGNKYNLSTPEGQLAWKYKLGESVQLMEKTTTLYYKVIFGSKSYIMYLIPKSLIKKFNTMKQNIKNPYTDTTFRTTFKEYESGIFSTIK